MTEPKLEITPAVTVHKLLEAYPELEDVLIGIAPPFKKLRNPILRKSVAKVATLKHAATVGGVPLNKLIAELKVVVGQAEGIENYDDDYEDYFVEEPGWFSTNRIELTIDESSDNYKDKMTIAYVMEGLRTISEGGIVELQTDFVPAPGIELMHAKGYQTWVLKHNNGTISTYFWNSRDR
ncbi:MAG TPA: hypothetical protein DCM64_06080 [Gammaproteobacteria bacterium]|mgnify:CR=1 FL=1|jgi:hypothetical protein|nr:DUF1858 domain-containing protein [Gammaproteobacteria bacterium]MDP6733457.1 DUF1858 domain-containing protein [Gammaproteobacteria bacterium]HAJ76006.1 hypothetical protein [Gammaproteobacteria bacterium]|tara:strand:+ start:3729 stop:4268 length:540 start_codon:yes stop_codon:yes gene_type:complete